MKDYQIIRQEFNNYNNVLLTKKEIILLTKSDQVNETTLRNVTKTFQSISDDVYSITAYDDQSVARFRQELLTIYQKLLTLPISS
jgi:GTPase involved in cell partitioning and DNA repair